MSSPRKLWQHPNPQSTQMWDFKENLGERAGRSFPTYDALFEYSATCRSDFWRQTFEYLALVYSGNIPKTVVDEHARIDSIPEWFTGVRMNWAENVLFKGDGTGRPIQSPGKEDDTIAVIEVREGGFKREFTWRDLRSRVGTLSQAMRGRGVKKGDRIAVVASNSIDTLTVFLAVTSLGGICSTTSTDMGVRGVLERLIQIRPRFVFMDDWSVYNQKKIDLFPLIQEVHRGLKGIEDFQSIVIQPRFVGEQASNRHIPNAYSWEDFNSAAQSSELVFVPCRFSDPFLIAYSSGTTGKPKCIVHSIGGVLLNGCKESRLHRDISDTSVCLQYTTTSWIMYLISVLSLAIGAQVVMYDGHPFTPEPDTLVKLAATSRVTHLGISPRYLQTIQSHGIVPKQVADLSNLKVISSTGMVLPDSLAEWVYDRAFPKSVHLDNIAGGTDLAGAFAAGNPILPLYLGGCQCRSLGLAVDVYDAEDADTSDPRAGKALAAGQAGELVCTSPFPSMPVFFWGEQGAQLYYKSYFERFDNVWTHGDYITIHPSTGQIIFMGRADGVLNPSGVRFGSSEIYGVIDANFSDSVEDSLCVGQRRPQDADERVMLFLLMKQGYAGGLSTQLVNEIKQVIRKELSPRHVPKFIFPTPEIPMTINAKKVELPVKKIVSGYNVALSPALANPLSLRYFEQFARDDVLNRGLESKL